MMLAIPTNIVALVPVLPCPDVPLTHDNQGYLQLTNLLVTI